MSIEVIVKKVSEIVIDDVEAGDVVEAVDIVKGLLKRNEIEFIDGYDDVIYTITARKYESDKGMPVEQKEIRVYA